MKSPEILIPNLKYDNILNYLGLAMNLNYLSAIKTFNLYLTLIIFFIISNDNICIIKKQIG